MAAKRVNGKFVPRMVEYRGKTVKLWELAKEHNINMRTVTTRIDRHGWGLEKALETPVKTIKKYTPSEIEKRKYGTRTKIVNKLMETFYADPERFETWCKEKMDNDYEYFYKNYVVPFLPNRENTLLDKGQEKAIINIEFKPSEPTVIEVTEK